MMAEYLRTKNFQSPQLLTPLKIYSFWEIHRELDNKAERYRIETEFAIRAAFETKDGHKAYRERILKLMDNANEQ